jgi:acyl-coenzyme A synthetase/AMP-(fatty) acid ligase
VKRAPTDEIRQEMLKVKGFQVAPAELEAQILTLSEISDTCVVGLPDEYSGELPLAFVVLSAKVKQQIGDDAAKLEALKKKVAKVMSTYTCLDSQMLTVWTSTLPTLRALTSGWREE